jgi:hypothetical protein
MDSFNTAGVCFLWFGYKVSSQKGSWIESLVPNVSSTQRQGFGEVTGSQGSAFINGLKH